MMYCMSTLIQFNSSHTNMSGAPTQDMRAYLEIQPVVHTSCWAICTLRPLTQPTDTTRIGVICYHNDVHTPTPTCTHMHGHTSAHMTHTNSHTHQHMCKSTHTNTRTYKCIPRMFWTPSLQYGWYWHPEAVRVLPTQYLTCYVWQLFLDLAGYSACTFYDTTIRLHITLAR